MTTTGPVLFKHISVYLSAAYYTIGILHQPSYDPLYLTKIFWNQMCLSSHTEHSSSLKVNDTTNGCPVSLLNSREEAPQLHFEAALTTEAVERLQFARTWPHSLQPSPVAGIDTLKDESDIKGVQLVMQSVNARMRVFEHMILGCESDLAKDLASDSDSTEPQQPDTLQQILIRLHSMEQRMCVLEQVTRMSSASQSSILANQRDQNELPASVLNVDDHCYSLFVQDFEPHTATLEKLCWALLPHYPFATKQSILDSIYSWFSSKRANFAQQVFTACQVYIQPKLDAGATLGTVKKEIGRLGELYATMITNSGLDVFTDEAVAVSFLLQNIDAYYDYCAFGNPSAKRADCDNGKAIWDENSYPNSEQQNVSSSKPCSRPPSFN